MLTTTERSFLSPVVASKAGARRESFLFVPALFSAPTTGASLSWGSKVVFGHERMISYLFLRNLYTGSACPSLFLRHDVPDFYGRRSGLFRCLVWVAGDQYRGGVHPLYRIWRMISVHTHTHAHTPHAKQGWCWVGGKCEDHGRHGAWHALVVVSLPVGLHLFTAHGKENVHILYPTTWGWERMNGRTVYESLL